jgi:hypothetical protein
LKHAVALLAASPRESLRNGSLALEAANKLADTWLRGDPQAMEAVAAAYAVNGKFKDAASRQQKAIRLATRLHWNISLMTERLAAYRSGQHWTGDLFVLPAAESLAPPGSKNMKRCDEEHKKQCERRKADPRERIRLPGT